MNIIETHNLTRRFGRTEAVHDLDFSVPQGSVCALLGPNGAGKSTTIKLLMNLLQPTAGEARVLGADSRRLRRRHFEWIGYVSENQQLPAWMTVRQYLDYCRPFYPNWDRGLEKELTDQFALPGDRKLGELSRGMLMKAARCSPPLSYRPKLLVLDEPFGGGSRWCRRSWFAGCWKYRPLAIGRCWCRRTTSRKSSGCATGWRCCTMAGCVSASRWKPAAGPVSPRGNHRGGDHGFGPGREGFGMVPGGGTHLLRGSGLCRRRDRARTWRERFPGAVISAQPMSLRGGGGGNFLSLARTERAAAGKKEAA